jgi:hypothetical protein
MTTHRDTLPFSPGNFFTKKQHDRRHHSPYFSLLLRLKIKLKGRHFDNILMIEAESQAVLNTLPEHDFLDAFEKLLSAGKDANVWKGNTSRVMVAIGLKVSF